MAAPDWYNQMVQAGTLRGVRGGATMNSNLSEQRIGELAAAGVPIVDMSTVRPFVQAGAGGESEGQMRVVPGYYRAQSPLFGEVTLTQTADGGYQVKLGNVNSATPSQSTTGVTLKADGSVDAFKSIDRGSGFWKTSTGKGLLTLAGAAAIGIGGAALAGSGSAAGGASSGALGGGLANGQAVSSAVVGGGGTAGVAGGMGADTMAGQYVGGGYNAAGAANMPSAVGGAAGTAGGISGAAGSVGQFVANNPGAIAAGVGLLGSAGAFGGPDMPAPPDYAALAQQQADNQLMLNRSQTQANRPDEYTPLGSRTWERDPNDPDKWVSRVTLDPAQQQLLDQSNARAGQFGDFSAQTLAGLGNYQQAPGFDPNAFQRAPTFDPNAYQRAPGVDGGTFDKVEDALYQRYDSRLTPQFDRMDDRLRQKLANQGLTYGGDAYTNAMRDLNFARNDAFDQARTSATLNAGAEQSRLFNMGLQGAQFNNNVLDGNFNKGLASADFNNAILNNNFNIGMQQAAFNNNVRGAQFGEAVQANSLAQPRLPEFGGYGSMPGTNTADMMGAAQNQFGAQQGQYNAQQAQQNNLWGGLVGIGTQMMTRR